MARQAVDLVVRELARLGALLRRPELMVFLPAATLAGFWLGGESALILLALGLPMVFVMAGAFRFPTAATADDGVMLRSQVLRRLEAALSGDGPDHAACLVVQFDDMARLVDRHGRTAQVEVLQQAANRAMAALRRSDRVAALEGGGFAVALMGTRRMDLETCVQVAARLQAALAAPYPVGGLTIAASCSVGICPGGRSPALRAQALLDAAQIAADEALSAGPNAIRVFAAEMAQRQGQRRVERETLEAALDEGQIRAHFQPQLNTDTGAVSGFEALARWHHPKRGILAPAEFLPAIHAAGLAERLHEAMLFQALSALKRWDAAGLTVPCVAINASAEVLRDPLLADKLRWELDRFGLAPERLGIEVLESVFAETDDDALVGNIAALARLGCGLDLDDFGTGHASITSIRRFSIRRIKIDRSFVARADEEADQRRMLAAILSMAEQLGVETLAEGVESPALHALCAQLGCRHVQGYAIARPMPLEDTIDWLRAQEQRRQPTPRIGHRAG
ncbi:bifunctional diguanylate cyclase/phosphodiesterase [Neotabrizicola shimadae]|uniref:GGDEF domain-containing protein n=1 Tax=Neotabrizicola shimadae TaxID=2807096 RepID=A0A8G0ZTS4_9RHOB|nr:bifunctional diguanylate cyclase/phosphodiesterase [Neotabrizicola shimadae]QYZ70294.1 GGDEF domain-containing protein [Neotabrizicola shimadae]